MPWLRVDDRYPVHPKTLRLRELLGQDLADAYPVRLWAWVINHAPGGDLSAFSNGTIATAAGFIGDPGAFVGALYEAGFLKVTENEPRTGRIAKPRARGDPLFIHDWADHSGKYETETIQGRKRMQQYREKQKRIGDANVRVTSALHDAEVTHPEVEVEVEVEMKDQDQNPLDRRTAKTARVDRLDVEYPDVFRGFWKTYPRKIGKGAALKAWKRLKPTPDLVSTILGAVEAQKSWPQWNKDGGQYIPHPTTWLNQRRWEDEPPTDLENTAKSAFVASVRKGSVQHE